MAQVHFVPESKTTAAATAILSTTDFWRPRHLSRHPQSHRTVLNHYHVPLVLLQTGQLHSAIGSTTTVACISYAALVVLVLYGFPIFRHATQQGLALPACKQGGVGSPGDPTLQAAAAQLAVCTETLQSPNPIPSHSPTTPHSPTNTPASTAATSAQ